MSITPNLMLKIRQQSAKVVQERTSNQESNRDAITKAATRVTDQVATIIAQTIADGGSYADIMPLLEDRDYSCDTWKDRLFGKSPAPSSLKGAAAAVFAWCEESGLQPFLAPYRGLNRSESRIVIQWEPAHMLAGLGSDATFVEQLQAVTAKAQAKKAAEWERERVKLVRKTIAEMHSEIARISKTGGTEVKVTTSYGGKAKPDLRDDSWTGDLIAYCEGLGLTIRVETMDDDYGGPFPGPRFKSEIFASWKAGMPPAK
jgi:hypothetical protein